MNVSSLRLEIPESPGSVSALYSSSGKARFLLVLAHGAGAGMQHPFMTTLSEALVGEGVATLRFQFPYMELGRKRPDRPALAQEAIRSAVREAKRIAPELPIFAGGKSFGGRMTSQLAAIGELETVEGLVFYGFPLHAVGRPSIERAAHLYEISQPMLFLQGTRDRLAEPDLIAEVGRKLPTATLIAVEDGDHSFKMLKRAGVSNEAVIQRLAEVTRTWMEETLSGH